MRVHAVAVRHVVHPEAFVDVAVGVDEAAAAVGLVILEPSFIERAVLPYLPAAPLPYHGIRNPLSLVLHIGIEQLFGSKLQLVHGRHLASASFTFISLMLLTPLRAQLLRLLILIAHLALLHEASQRLLLIIIPKLKLSQELSNLLHFLASIISCAREAATAIIECSV